eukprot:11536321-Alexandrium_andersonii.AAC.1
MQEATSDGLGLHTALSCSKQAEQLLCFEPFSPSAAREREGEAGGVKAPEAASARTVRNAAR